MTSVKMYLHLEWRWESLGGQPTFPYQYDRRKICLHIEWRWESNPAVLREPRLLGKRHVYIKVIDRKFVGWGTYFFVSMTSVQFFFSY